MREMLLLSIGFSPNVGGIETHFDDLTAALDKRGWKAWVLTYKPIATPVTAKFFERRGRNVVVYRVPWVRGIFYKLVSRPVLEFLFLVPGLFLALPVFLAWKGRRIEVVQSHGLVAGFVAAVWGKLWGKRVIMTTHSMYNFPARGLYRRLARWIFASSDKVLTLSAQSAREVVNLGVEKDKVKRFTYWVDLKKFRPVAGAKKKVGWEGKFVVLFVGRLIGEKGINELLAAAKIWSRQITLAVAGGGPMERKIQMTKSKIQNLEYLGRVEQEKLPVYYSAADVVIVPSVHEEGFGRVILEALACGTPVIGARRGAIPEAMDETVGRLIEVTPEKIKQVVEDLWRNPGKLKRLAQNARKFAQRRYGEKNIGRIIRVYSD